jgi:hypothetical protein
MDEDQIDVLNVVTDHCQITWKISIIILLLIIYTLSQDHYSYSTNVW